MADFDFTGANNAPDAGGAGAPPIPAPASIPSPAGPVAPQVDPRAAAVLSRLTPQPPASPWVEAIRKIVPLIAGVYAMSQGGGGSFASGLESAQKQQALAADQKAQEDLRLATILHQQEQEKAVARNAQIAQERIDETAKRERDAKQRTEELTRYNDLAKGPIFQHANEIAASQGKDAADQYLAQFEGFGGTLKDLVNKYGVRNSQTGEIALGQTKTPKETKAGTQEDWVENAERLDAQKRGRPLTDAERQAVDAAAIKEYKNLSKDPQADEIALATKRLQQTLDELKIKQIKDAMDQATKANAEIQPGSKEYKQARDLAFGILSFEDFVRLHPYERGQTGTQRTNTMNAIYDKAREINPDFSPELFKQGGRFAGSPQTKRSLAAVANVESGIPSMLEASDAATRSNIKAVNQYFVIPGGVQIGDKSYANLSAAHKAFADELSLALGVGSASDLKTKLGLDIADPNLDPAAFRSVLETQIAPFLERRKASLKAQMGPYAADRASQMVPPPAGGPPAVAPQTTSKFHFDPATNQIVPN